MKRFISIGERLRELRGSLSQREFIKKTGVPHRTYQRYENGERMPPVDILNRIADKCNTTTQWLLTGKSDKYPYKEIGRRIREAKFQSYSQIGKDAIARILGVTIPEYAKYESGEIKPPHNVIKKIAKLFKTSVNWILKGDDNKKHAINIETDITPKSIKQWIDNFWQKASHEEKIWFKIQLQQSFPEYKSWLLKKKHKK